jgi:hypothetical protein
MTGVSAAVHAFCKRGLRESLPSAISLSDVKNFGLRLCTSKLFGPKVANINVERKSADEKLVQWKLPLRRS